MRKQWVWIVFGLAAFLMADALFSLDAALRASMERDINRRLKGYSVRVGAVSFHPLGFSLDLLDVTAVQSAHPDPPVLRIARLRASIQWRALLQRRLVADMLIEHPQVRLNLLQARAEMRSPVPVRERGWQEALQAIYPLKVNELRVRDAELTYVDQAPFPPLRLSGVTLRAENIRNIRSPEHVYPSGIHLNDVVFDSGRVVLDGNADFLAKPHMGLRASLSLEGVDLDYFKPIMNRYNVMVQRGTFSSSGHFEYAPRIKVVNFEEVTIHGADIAYVHKPETAAAEQRRVEQIQRTARQLSNHPEVLLRMNKVSVLQSTLHFRNKAADPPYRLFLADAEIHFANVSNRRAEGTATGSLEGKFMGSGDATIDTRFSPEGKRLDFDLMVRIDKTQMRAMNDLLRAYAGFDVGGGQFSLYSQVNVRRGKITGYLKPLFRDVEVYDARQDRDKELFQQMKEWLIDGIATLLENPSRREVATRVNLSGTIDSPQFSSWEAVAGLLRNAFLRPILPGLEGGAARRSR